MKNKVQLNSKVTIKCNNALSSYYIVRSEDLDTTTTKISSSSPLGELLLKSKVKDVIKVKTPNGITEYEVVSVK
jgi:transcription elongation GreA/GreB family factor